MDVLKHCPVCQNIQFRLFLTCTDYLVSHRQFDIVDCVTCKLRFTNPRPDAQSIGNYYQSDEYISHSDTQKGLIGSLYKLVRHYTLREKVKLITSLNKNAIGRLLDIGCGTGAFLSTAQKSGWQVTGVEPDERARKLANQRTGQQIVSDLDKHRGTMAYDTITMWHVLEHIPNLSTLFRSAKENLTAQGHFIVAVPNSNSWDAKRYGSYWAAYDVPRHLYHFTPETMSYVADTFGFRIIRQDPMYFDAYYIAMLSSRYRAGHTRYLETIVTGIKSNWNARKSGNYSSIVYVMQPC